MFWINFWMFKGVPNTRSVSMKFVLSMQYISNIPISSIIDFFTVSWVDWKVRLKIIGNIISFKVLISYFSIDCSILSFIKFYAVSLKYWDYELSTCKESISKIFYLFDSFCWIIIVKLIYLNKILLYSFQANCLL